MAKTITEAPRKNMFMERPEDLVLITDEKHPLYDPRVHLPLQESLVRNIMVYGVKEPVLVRKVGGQKEIVAGRQRVKHAREANIRFRNEGAAELRVPVIYENGDDEKMLGIMVLENEARQNTDPLQKAKNAQKLIDAGYTDQEAADTFGVTVQTIRDWKATLNLPAKIQKAIERQEIKPTAARKLASLPPEKQEQALDEMKASGGRLTVARAARAARGDSPAPGKRLRSRAEIVEEYRVFGTGDLTEYDRGYVAALRWVLHEKEADNDSK